MAPSVGQFPAEFVWVSKRLTSHIVRHETATTAKPVRVTEAKVSPTLIGQVLGVEATLGRRELQTPADYAVEATKVLHRRGAIGDIFSGEYVRMTLDLNLATFTVPWYAWEANKDQLVATLYGRQFVHPAGLVFVGLFGSPHNLLARMEEESYTGRTPSDADGLYRILQQGREPSDSPLKEEGLRRLREYEADDRERVDLAAEILSGLSDPFPSRPIDVLIKVDVRVRDHVLDEYRWRDNPTRYDVCIIGTPIWAGIPQRRLYSVADRPSDRAKDQYWPLFDKQLFESIVNWRKGAPFLPPAQLVAEDPDAWRAFAAWFVSLGCHFGYRPTEVSAYRRPSRWNLRRYVGRAWRHHPETFNTGVSGYHLALDARRDVVVTADGSAVPVLDEHGLYRPEDRDARWMERGGRPEDVSSDCRDALIEAMWTRAATWRRHFKATD